MVRQDHGKVPGMKRPQQGAGEPLTGEARERQGRPQQGAGEPQTGKREKDKEDPSKVLGSPWRGRLEARKRDFHKGYSDTYRSQTCPTKDTWATTVGTELRGDWGLNTQVTGPMRGSITGNRDPTTPLLA